MDDFLDDMLASKEPGGHGGPIDSDSDQASVAITGADPEAADGKVAPRRSRRQRGKHGKQLFAVWRKLRATKAHLQKNKERTLRHSADQTRILHKFVAGGAGIVHRRYHVDVKKTRTKLGRKSRRQAYGISMGRPHPTADGAKNAAWKKPQATRKGAKLKGCSI